MKLRHQLTYQQTPESFEVHTDDEILVQEGQAMTIMEILTKFSQGINVNNRRKVYFETDDNIDNLDNEDPTKSGDFDLADYSELQSRLNASADAQRSEMQRAKQSSMKASEASSEANNATDE